MTDPGIEAEVRQRPVGVYDPDDLAFDGTDVIYLTLSLGEPFHGYCFKLVAAVIAA